MQIGQVMMSFTQLILIRYEERYLRQIVSEMFASLQLDSSQCAPQYRLNSFVTMTTYWVPTSTLLKAFLATFAVVFLSVMQ